MGGPDTLAVPPGALAAQWLIDQHYAELFIGYASYAPRLTQHADLQVMFIPARYNVEAEYGWATLSSAAQPLADFLMSDSAQSILRQHGFA